MILLVLFLLALALYLVMIGMKKSWRRLVMALTLSSLILAGMGVIMIHDLTNWGLAKTTTTEHVALVSTIPKQAAIVKKPLGTSATASAVYLYRTVVEPKRVQQAVPTLHRTIILKHRRGITPQLIKTTVRWRYQNTGSAFLFMGTGENHQLVKQSWTFILPSTWQVERLAHSIN